MALFLAFAAAILCALNNLFMRRSIDAGGSTKAFLVFVEGFSIFVAFILGPLKTGHYQWNTPIALIGLVAGVFLGIMMWALGRAMEQGPPGLTVAVLNSSVVVPAVIMVLLFGVSFGHSYQWWNGAGSTLVVLGLFWASWQTVKSYENRAFWFTFAMLAFWCHVMFLIIIQWRAMLVNPHLPVSRLLPIRIDMNTTEWFMPMIFIAATIFLLVVFLKDERRVPKFVEVSYGFFGGVCNGACTYFLILAAQRATAIENAMIFPVFAVSLIMLCNSWGRVLYKEKVHWRAMAVCLVGLFIGTVDWKVLFQ